MEVKIPSFRRTVSHYNETGLVWLLHVHIQLNTVTNRTYMYSNIVALLNFNVYHCDEHMNFFKYLLHSGTCSEDCTFQFHFTVRHQCVTKTDCRLANWQVSEVNVVVKCSNRFLIPKLEDLKFRVRESVEAFHNDFFLVYLPFCESAVCICHTLVRYISSWVSHYLYISLY